jgi:hypothetical protein
VKTLAIFGMVAAWFGAVAIVVTAFGLMQEPSLRPAQPIEFPHRIHVTDIGMECAYCHQYVEKSIHAGLPDAELCMTCHEAVATDKPEVAKLAGMYQAGQPVEWVRVYQIKPHVYFTHKRHVLSGVKCQECHGPVELMTTAQRVTDLGMGWCLECHNSRGASRECITCHK